MNWQEAPRNFKKLAGRAGLALTVAAIAAGCTDKEVSTPFATSIPEPIPTPTPFRIEPSYTYI